MPPELSVLIANHNTSAFLEVSLHALAKLSSCEYTVLIHDDGSRDADVRALEALVTRHPNAHLFKRPPEPRGGSWAHASALDFLFSQVDTPYTAVFDADCTPLMRGWDRWMIDQLDQRTKIVGSGLGEGWAGNKPVDFPLPFMALWESDAYRQLGVSAMPADIAEGQDSCWEWRPKFTAAGYAGIVLRSVNTRFTPVAPFDDVICGLYFTHDDRLLGSHFGRGSTPESKRSRLPARADALMRRFGGRRLLARSVTRERKRWRKICLEIVREQSAKATGGGQR